MFLKYQYLIIQIKIPQILTLKIKFLLKTLKNDRIPSIFSIMLIGTIILSQYLFRSKYSQFFLYSLSDNQTYTSYKWV